MVERPDKIRVQRTDGQLVVLRRPVIRGDSVWGQIAEDSGSVPLDDVSAIDVQRTDWLKTAGLVVLSTGAFLGIACAIACDVGPDFSFSP